MFSFSYFLLAYFDLTKGLIKADSKSNSTHFIMNHHELLTLIQSCQAILTFLVNRGLLAAKRICSCGNQMVLRDNKSDDGYHWECPVNQCRKRRSIRAGTFFEDSKICNDRIFSYQVLSCLRSKKYNIPRRKLSSAKRKRYQFSFSHP